MNKITLGLIAFFLFEFAQAQNRPFVRFPALSPDGKTLSFSYQGDICTVPSSGGNALRLTIHEGYEGQSLWSPDGKNIAFVSNRFGHDDVFVIPASGAGQTRRLTFHGTKDVVTDWHGETIYFSTRRENVHAERERETHQIAQTGGTSKLFLQSLGDEAVISPDGRFVAYTRGTNTNDRYAYKGAAQKDIWLFDTKKQTFLPLSRYEGNDINPQWADSRTLLYISAQSGKFNIYKVQIDEAGQIKEKPVAITSYKEDNVRYFKIAENGKTLAYEYETDIYLTDLESGKTNLVEINIPSDFRLTPVEYKKESGNMSAFAISPNGKLLAYSVRGEIFVKENGKDKPRSVCLSQHSANDKNPAWLNDSTLIYASDRFGQYDLILVRSTDATEKNLFKTLKREEIRLTESKEDEEDFVPSPDGKKIAFKRGLGDLIVSDITGGALKNEVFLQKSWAQPSGMAWSPDSKYLAYSAEDLLFNEEIYIQSAEGGKPVNISMHPKADNNPIWSADGSKLGFLSARNNGNFDIWYVWLKKSDWEKTEWEREREEEPEKDENKPNGNGNGQNGKEKPEEKIVKIVIDFDKIYERLVQLTSLPGNESDLNISKDGKTFYFVTNRSGRSSFKADNDLFSVKFNGKEMKNLTSGNQSPYALTPDRSLKNLYFLTKGGRLTKIDLSTSKTENLAFTASYSVHHGAERMQIFNEAWRTINNGFYDPKFHGRDWDALRKKYEKRAEKASTERDFRDAVNNMLGEIDASHMGLYGADRAVLPLETTGLLGVAIEPLKEGVKVLRVVPNTPADREKSKLTAGDVITAVDGVNITSADNFYAFFINKTDIEVLLQVKDAGGKMREVVIIPENSINTQLYEEWVSDRRALTDKLSGGKLGYLHIEGMDWESFERFEREITAVAEGKEGIVIDVRYNGGGWTTDYLMITLGTRQHAYTVPRGSAADLEKEHKNFKQYYPYSERLPFAVWTKSSIALCNESSYSNAEIFSHAYKNLKMGTLVGMPTYGAVISTGGRTLIDGSLVRLPFRGWYSFQGDENMELVPAKPDVLLDNAPDSKFKGRDEQLEKAVQLLLKK